MLERQWNPPAKRSKTEETKKNKKDGIGKKLMDSSSLSYGKSYKKALPWATPHEPVLPPTNPFSEPHLGISNPRDNNK